MVIKYPKSRESIPNGHEMYKHFPIYVRPSKINPNWDFWFENKPSGNRCNDFIHELASFSCVELGEST
jgi:hypothetical protein